MLPFTRLEFCRIPFSINLFEKGICQIKKFATDCCLASFKNKNLKSNLFRNFKISFFRVEWFIGKSIRSQVGVERSICTNYLETNKNIFSLKQVSWLWTHNFLHQSKGSYFNYKDWWKSKFISKNFPKGPNFLIEKQRYFSNRRLETVCWTVDNKKSKKVFNIDDKTNL